jgi:hypothetical protein
MEQGKFQKQGICSNCGSDNIDWHGSDFEGDSVYYMFTCNECSKDGKEWFRLEYFETVTEGDDD